MFVLTSFSPPPPFSLLNVCIPFSRLYFIRHRANIKMSERTQDEFSYVDDGGRTDDRLQYALTIYLDSSFSFSLDVLFAFEYSANIILLLAQRKYSRRRRTTTNIVWFGRVK
jgi:hypothetical protein